MFLEILGKEIIWAMRCEWFDTSPLQGEEGVRVPHGPFLCGLTSVGRRTD